MKTFDREKLKILPLSSRKSKTSVEEITIDFPSHYQPPKTNPDLEKIAIEIINARKNNKPIILAFGAHLVKNKLNKVLIDMIENNYITHLATNGAGSIHDWEFAFHGKTEEDVRENIGKGQFGIWEETGKYINLALIHGAKEGKGYGESIAEMIHTDNPITHPYKQFSIQNSAFTKNIPFTVHPGFGYDIIYTHPLSDGASIGKTAEIDFLRFTESVSQLQGGGVYISIGSAVMSPMIFEKSLSMARNVAHQQDKKIEDFTIVINDIKGSSWDFKSNQEPDKGNPAYYERFCKTFSRMGAKNVHYIKADNREFLLGLKYYLGL